MNGRRVLLLLLSVLFLLFVIYWASTYFMVYSDDAYVDSDLIGAAPLVDGPIIAVYVQDNQAVNIGDALYAIDPKPYELKVLQAKSALSESSAQLALLKSSYATAVSRKKEKLDALDLARKTHARFSDLIEKQAISQEEFDTKNELFKTASDELEAATSELVTAEAALTVQADLVAVAQAAYDLAVYYRDHTTVCASVAGFVNALRIRPGDYVKAGQAVVGIVDDSAWRVVSNYREYLVRHMEPGQKVVVYLDGHPWQLFSGVVEGIGRGISRSLSKPKLLPYVDPTIDWIRLPKRLPVRIRLVDVPASVRLHMGADARTLVMYSATQHPVPANTSHSVSQ
ncbi:HlyD family secretion protein [Desulfovibrio inopinatus]|uniref:HlyD family secretion protein n=1 Tax=Desulfovibrio inopinatus TaxID=102109 RepID=UPI000413F28C|nr:HlyD family secretion protein [Desulfovibrio inopinatus]